VLSSDGRDGTVYSFKPGSPDTEVTVIAPTPAADHPGAATVLPVNWWNNGEFKDQLDPETYQFTTLAEMFARDMARRSPGNTSRRTAAWSCRPIASSSRGRPTSGAALLGRARHLRLHHGQAGAAGVRHQQLGEQDL
jgi:hypothetical protein